MQKESELNIFQKVVLSNDLHLLADRLAEDFFAQGSHLFERRLIVVVDSAMKEFLLYRLAHNPKLQIAAGIEILPLNQAVADLLEFSSPLKNKRIPTFLELSVAIEEELLQKEEIMPVLTKYLHADDPEKKRRKISSLSSELARLFGKYGLYAEHSLPKWLKQEGWQQTLWKAIFSSDSAWTYPLEALGRGSGKIFSGKLALFGFSYLPRIYLHFFHTFLATLYPLSPCAHFWEDFSSEKERMKIRHKRLKKEVRTEIDQYMQESHPLLGNWGKLGREMARSFHGFVLHEEEHYKEPEGKDALASLKRSLLTLEEPVFLAESVQIQLHSASSQLREIEILRDTIETLMHEHNEKADPLFPRDILVVAPNIEKYASYIQMVFSKSDLPFSIAGLPLSYVSEALRGFLQLLQLPQERFSLSSLFELFMNHSFYKRQGWDIEQIHRLRTWCEQAEIDRDLSGEVNSWREGLKRLVHGLAMKSPSLNAWPIEIIPLSETSLFNQFLELFSNLQSDLELFTIDRKIGEWFALLLKIAERYFTFEWEREPFFQELKSLSQFARHFGQEKWNRLNVDKILSHLAQKPTAEIHSSQMQKIRFLPLQFQTLPPARLIWCLGMDETSFPRSDQRTSLSFPFEKEDYAPSQAEEDRSLFLELFLKAQEYLFFSYERIDKEDGKQRTPSFLIEELNQYLTKRGMSKGMFTFDHPTFPLDALYFSKESRVKRWLSRDYLAAKAYYSEHKQAPPLLSSCVFSSHLNQEIYIDIRHLKKCAQHPIKFYCNETWKIYLKEKEDPEEKRFLLSHLRIALIRKKRMTQSLDALKQQLEGEGKLPQGLFREAAWQMVEEELLEYERGLQRWGIDPSDVKSHSLSMDVGSQLTLPLSNGRIVHLVGEIDNCCAKGLILHSKGAFKELVQIWPLYLIFCCLYPASHQILCTKRETILGFPLEDPYHLLAAYIEYYLAAKESPSPFIPDWASSILQKDLKKLEKQMNNSVERADPYLHYFHYRNSFPLLKERAREWGEKLQPIFSCFKEEIEEKGEEDAF